jgi:hypothetical protein
VKRRLESSKEGALRQFNREKETSVVAGVNLRSINLKDIAVPLGEALRRYEVNGKHMRLLKFFHGFVLSGVGRDGRQAACQRVE